MGNKINQAVRGTPEPSVFHGRRGWKSSNSSPLPAEGEIFSLTFPFIEQAFALRTGIVSAMGILQRLRQKFKSARADQFPQ